MESFSEVFGNSAADPIPSGFRFDDLIVGLRINGADSQTGELGSDIHSQLRTAYSNLRAFVESAGGTLDNVGQVSFFLKDIDHRDLINEPWVKMFPDSGDRPTYKFMPADLAENELVRLEMFAVLGARRKAIHVAGVAHVNPIPMAVQIGRYLFSSRMLPYDPATEKPAGNVQDQADYIFQHASTVLNAAGMGWADVMQGRAFYAEDSGRALIADRWQARFGNTATAPPLHPVQYFAGDLLVMLEFIAMESK